MTANLYVPPAASSRTPIFPLAAPKYLSLGWPGVLKMPVEEKYPPPPQFTGFEYWGKYADAAQVARWSQESDFHNIGLRLPDGLLGIDVDAYDGRKGMKTLVELEAQYGKLPDTWITTSRADGTGSGIRIFRVPEGVHWRSKLFDNEGNDGNIEIIQHGHRYVMVWPSVHPKTKQIYTWYGPGWTQALQPPRPRDFAALPQAWVNYLAMGAPRRVMDLGKLDRSGSDAESFFKDDRRFTWKQFQGFIEPHMTRLINAPTGTINNTLNDACKVLSHFVPQFIDWETAEGWIWDALGRNKDYDGEAQKTSGTIESGFGSTVEKGDWIAQRVEETEQTKAEGPLPSYPASFWESRKVFAHIRQAAHHRGRSGDLVLAATLVRLSAMVSPRLRFDIGLGPASLNLGAVAIGGTGTGKSSGSEVAKTMIDAPNYLTTGSADLNEPMKFLDMAAVGSGEGIAEVFWGSKLVQVSKAKNGEPKMQMVRQRIRENVFFFVDEGQTMMKQAERNGTTIGGTLRTALTGGGLGQNNGTKETTRPVEAGTYSLGILIGFQKHTAKPLIDEADAGTPQRFLFVAATDPSVPDYDHRVPHPGKLPVGLTVPNPSDICQPLEGVIKGTEAIEREIWNFNCNQVGGGGGDGNLESHMPMMRGKISALLALLDGRMHITDEDWQLSGVIWEVSRAVREAVMEHNHKVSVIEAEARTEASVERAVRTAVAVTDAPKRLDRIARLIAAHAAAAEGGELSMGQANKHLASRDRQYLNAAVDRGVDAGSLTRTTTGLAAGPAFTAVHCE